MQERRRRLVLRAAPILAAVGLVALLATGAWGEKLKTRSSEASVGPGEIDSTKATCPKGTRAISGGFQSDVNLTGNEATAAIESRRSGNRRWVVSAFGVGSGSDFTAYGYCRDEKLKTKSKTVEIQGHSLATQIEEESVTAKCPKGTTVLSGGFDNSNAFIAAGSAALVFPYQSQKQGKRKWLASGSNLGNEDADFRSYAYCQEGEKLSTKRDQDAVPPIASPTDLAELTAKCGRKQRVVSGGFDTDDPFANSGGGVLVLESRKQGARKWVVSVANLGTDTETVVAYAYCEDA